MEIWDGVGGYGDETSQALEKQLRDIEIAEIPARVEEGRKKYQDKLRKQLKKLGYKPVA